MKNLHIIRYLLTNILILMIFMTSMTLSVICWIFFNKVCAWQKSIHKMYIFNHKLPSRHGCISDASLRHLMQCLRDISKRADWQTLETSPVRCIKDVSSETSLRSRRSSQRRLWVTFQTVIRYLQPEAFFGYILIYLHVFKYFANLI